MAYDFGPGPASSAFRALGFTCAVGVEFRVQGLGLRI